jgi:IPT/TIG domain-containing protein
VKLIVAILFASGCATEVLEPPPPGPPPLPVITGMTPTTGAYGTKITITGTGLSTAGTVPGKFDTVTFPGVDALLYYQGTDTEVQLQVPFPATPGPIVLHAPGGVASTPSFTPISTWIPGPSVPAFSVVEARMIGTTLIVLGLQGANASLQAALFTNDTATSYSLAGVTGSYNGAHPTDAHVVADDSGRFEVIATTTMAKVVVFSLFTVQPSAADTGLSGRVLAAARDASGVYAWVWIPSTTTTAAHLDRVRPGATATAPWSSDRTIPFSKVLDAQLAADGTLVLAYGVFSGTIVDNEEKLAIGTLPPAATALASVEYPDGVSYDDYIASARLLVAGDGKRMLVTFSTQETDKVADIQHGTLSRGANGTWASTNISPFGDDRIVFTATSIAALHAAYEGPSIIPDVMAANPAPEVVPVWPLHVEALVMDGDRLRPLMSSNELWFLSPPAP